MHFFCTFGSTLVDVTISLGQTVGSSELAIAYAKNSRGTESAVEITGRKATKPITPLISVQQIVISKKTARKEVSAIKIKRTIATKKGKETKKRNSHAGRFKSPKYGRKTKKAT
jgi:hypothetical protein